MSKTRSLLAATALLATFSVPAPVFAQAIPDDIAGEATLLRDAAMRDTIAYELVESLTMEVGPRPAGSAGDKASIKWAVQMLTGLGFSNVHTEEVTVPHWERGSIQTNIIAPFPQALVSTSLGGSPGTPEAGLEAEVVHERFTEFVQSHPNIGAHQIKFLDLIQKHIAKYGSIQVEQLYEPPFTTLHTESLDGLFEEDLANELFKIIEGFASQGGDDE